MDNIRIFYWATLFGSVNFLEPIMTLFYLQRGMSDATVLYAALAWSMSVLVFEVPTGAFADRFGPKASFICGCGIGLVGKACLIFAHDPWMFYLYSILDGLAVTFFSGADEALIYDSLKEENKEDTMGAVVGRIESAGYIPMIMAFSDSF